MLAFALCLVVGSSGLTAAEEPAVQPAPDDALRVVYTDGRGHYLLLTDPTQRAGRRQKLAYYGDAKAMWRLVSAGVGHSDKSPKGQPAWFEWSFRDHRNMPSTISNRGPAGLHVRCGERVAALTQLSAGDARAFAAKARLEPPRFQRRAHRLARDDRGTYYYVDRLRDAAGGKGFRVFKGQRGAMKKLKMLNIVQDSVGEIFATRSGNLRLVVDRRGEGSTWIKGRKHIPLTQVPITRNLQLIYVGMGVYDGVSFGTPCDDV